MKIAVSLLGLLSLSSWATTTVTKPENQSLVLSQPKCSSSRATIMTGQRKMPRGVASKGEKI